MMRSFLVLVFIALSITAHAGSPRIHNHAPEFVSFWEQVKDQSLEKQIEEFERVIFPTFPEFYTYKYKRWEEAGRSKEEMLKKSFDAYRSMHARFAERTDALSSEISENLATFLARFPDFDTDFDIYIIHSLGDMDGGTRMIDGKLYFIFGVDGIVKYHNGTRDAPFFHHELFHMYHWQYFKGEEKMWSALWFEGFATYVSEVLNPGSSIKDLMLDTPEGLIENCEKDINFLWADFYSILDSGDGAAYQKYFLLGSKDKRVPQRAGYYLGYLVAKELARSYSVDELVKMDPVLVRALIGEVILRLSSSMPPA